MNEDVRWRQRLNSYSQSIENLEEVCARRSDRELDRVELQALIKSFELCYETGWNLMKDWMEYQGTTSISGSRDAIRAAFAAGLLTDGDGWMQMLQTRNRTAHSYNQTVAREVEQQIVTRYREPFHAFAQVMRLRAQEEKLHEGVLDIPGLSESRNSALRNVFQRFQMVQTVVLYGSRAKKSNRNGSDIDLCIREPAVDLDDVLAIEQAIDDLLLPFHIDLSVYATIDDPAVRDHIDRVGTLFYRRQPSL